MSKVIVNQYIPDYVSPPGETLLEILEERGISIQEFAEISGIATGNLNYLITGEAEITAGLAINLEQILGIPAHFWHNREKNYRDALARHSNSKVHYSKEHKPMTQGPKKPNSPNAPNLPTKQERKEPAFTPANTSNSQQTKGITNTIISEIDKLGSLKEYPIRLLVEHAKNFGEYLKNQRLETNQVRKFLDAINQIKNSIIEDNDFSKIETSVVLLKPKLVYAAARQSAAKPLSDVMSVAIDKVNSIEDFERLVQFIESIIAYHKAAGEK